MSRRRSFTQPQRLSIYRLRLEMASIPTRNCPSWHWQDETHRQAARQSIIGLLSEISRIGSDPAEAARNARWARLGERLSMAVAVTARKRQAAIELAKLANVDFPNKFQRTLAEIDIRFGGRKAADFMRGAA